MKSAKSKKIDTAVKISTDLLSFDGQKKSAESIQQKAHGYTHSQRLTMLDQLEAEFQAELATHQLYEGKDTLDSDEKQKAFANACMLYFVALILKQHYQDYALAQKQQYYAKLVDELERDLFYHQTDASKEEAHFQLTQFIKKIARKAVSTSLYRDVATYINLQRIYWIFCKLTMVEIDVIFNRSSGLPNADKLTQIICLPNDINNVLSVAIFSLRLVHDIAMIVKHTIGNKAERENSTWSERLSFELKKRCLDMLNNVVWGVINFITNYGKLCGISDVTGGYIISALLVFDIALVSFKRIEARKKYASAKASLNRKIQSANGEKKLALEQQLHELEKDWLIKTQVFNFNQLAASFIFAGWTASLFMPPAAMLIGFIVVTLGVAMYMSSDLYAAFVKADMELKEAIHNNASDETITALEKRAFDAKLKVGISVAEKTIVPITILLTTAACWPAGVAMLALYALIKISLAIHSKYKENKAQEENEEAKATKKVGFFAQKCGVEKPECSDDPDFELQQTLFA